MMALSFNLKLMNEKKEYNIRHRCFHFSKEVIVFVQNSRIEKILFSIYDQLIKVLPLLAQMLWKEKRAVVNRI